MLVLIKNEDVNVKSKQIKVRKIKKKNKNVIRKTKVLFSYINLFLVSLCKFINTCRVTEK